MKKKTFSIVALLIALMLVVFTGCEAEVKNEPDETTKESTTAVTQSNAEEDTTIANGVSLDRVNSALANNSVADDKNSAKPDGNNTANVNTPGGNNSSDKSDATTQSSGSSAEAPEEVDGEVAVQDDAAVLMSDTFYMDCRVVAGDSVSRMRVARDGSKLSMYVDAPEQNIGVIFVDETIYMMLPEKKIYTIIYKELMDAAGMSSDEFFEELNRVTTDEGEYKEYSEADDGVNYTVRESESGVKSYYIGKTLIKRVDTSGEVMYVDNITTTPGASLFAPPSGYTEKTVAEFSKEVE